MPQPPAHKPLGIPFIELQSVDSTNNYARSLIKESSLPDRQLQSLHGTAIFAHEQVAGKGQRGKSWSSEKSANIILSIVVNPDSLYDGPFGQHSGQFQLSACVAASLHEFFQKYAGNTTTIKWPNDLYWQDRKAGGVLIESGVRSGESGIGSQEPAPESEQRSNVITNWNWAIVGIGININQTSFPPEIKNPVSLKQITGKGFSAIELAKELCQILDKKLIQLNEDGFTDIYHYYLEHLYKKDKKVRLRKDNQVFEGTIKGVSRTGQLIVLHGIEEMFDFGTIEWII